MPRPSSGGGPAEATFQLESSDVLFPVPLLVFRLDEAQALNVLLEREIAARRVAEPSHSRSNRGGWHSANDLFGRVEPGHRTLAQALLPMLRTASERWLGAVDWHRVELWAEGWANVSGGDDYHSPHDHPSALWAGVYYVKVPPADGGGGEIEFLSGRAGGAAGSLVPAPMTWDYFRVRPAPGSVLLFPGHLRHWVPPTRSADERISVAFNAYVRQRQAPEAPADV